MTMQEKIAFVGMATFVSSGMVLAQPVGLGFGPGIEVTTTHDATPGTNSFEINGPDAFFDPAAGAWRKILNAPSNGFQPGAIYNVHEWITFFPPPTGVPGEPLRDWHETIEFAPDGQLWDIWTTMENEPVVSLEPGSDQPVPGFQFSLSDDSTQIWFDFDPLFIPADGLTLHIYKDFRFIGNSVSFDPVIITQYPTPAPASALLLGIAGLTANGRRRR